MSAIELKNLTYVYGGTNNKKIKAINNISLKIEKGCYVGIIGHTGSGKSTLIQHINGILKPTFGNVYINGEDIWASNKKRANIRTKIGLVFQYPEYQLFEETIEKDIAFGPQNLGLNDDEIKKRVHDACIMVGLSKDILHKSPFEISGGQKRRVALAGIIAMMPKILVLDEPTAGLDPMGRDKILDMIKDYHKKTECTVLHVTHSMEDVAKYADKIIVMNKGQIFDYNSVENIFKRANELQKIGLDIPEISQVFIKLKNRGFDVPTNIYTVKQAIKVLNSLIAKKAEQ